MRARFRSLLLLLPALLLNTGVRAGTVDGTINPNYGNNLGRAVVAASPGFGTANPGLRAMATSLSGRTWLFGEDRSGLQNELLLIARLDAATGQIDAGFGGGDGLVTVGFPAGINGPKIDGALIQPDGKPLIFGYAFHLLGQDYETVGLICRLNVAGNFDLSFGSNGCRMITGLASHHESCTVRDLKRQATTTDDRGRRCRDEAGATNLVFVAAFTGERRLRSGVHRRRRRLSKREWRQDRIHQRPQGPAKWTLRRCRHHLRHRRRLRHRRAPVQQRRHARPDLAQRRRAPRPDRHRREPA
jgi:hypothetical protein